MFNLINYKSDKLIYRDWMLRNIIKEARFFMMSSEDELKEKFYEEKQYY